MELAPRGITANSLCAGVTLTPALDKIPGNENIVDEATKNLPDYVTIDYKDIWENKLSKDYFEIDCDMSEYTYGHIFRKKLNIFSKDS